MSDMSDDFTKYMFHYVPDMPFEVKDELGIVVNGATAWNHVPLQAGIMQHFLHEFVSDTGLVTDLVLTYSWMGTFAPLQNSRGCLTSFCILLTPNGKQIWQILLCLSCVLIYATV